MSLIDGLLSRVETQTAVEVMPSFTLHNPLFLLSSRKQTMTSRLLVRSVRRQLRSQKSMPLLMEDGPAQAATTDLPVKEIPELLEWFNEKLATTLFPMLAARYPEKVKNATDLRAHDSFIVKYDGYNPLAQNSLAEMSQLSLSQLH